MRLYKIFGIVVTPLFLLESELPLAVEDVAEQIILRQEFALKLIEPEDKP